MDGLSPNLECDVCGSTSFFKESGHFYCNECQTQSQQVQEHVFEQEDGKVKAKSTKKIQKEKSKKSEEHLTSWECFNVILKGLTGEMMALGAKPELVSVVRCLWMKYLHKCEVFDVNSDRLPKVSLLGSKKDLKILYSVKKRKRSRSRTSSRSSAISAQRERSGKKRALIHSQYEELSQSQSLTQGSSLMNDSLSSLKSNSEGSEGSKRIEYDKFSNAELKRVMSKKHKKMHQEDLTGELTCHKLQYKDFRQSFAMGPANLTSSTLYAILYIGLLIIDDPIQLGDLLRFIREGHLSFDCYRHFFDEDISENTLNLPNRKVKLFSHYRLRKLCVKLIMFLEVSSYINQPDLMALCSRYCTELNLPQAVFECSKKLIWKTAPKMAFTHRSRTIPNYEGRALSFILFSLKLLFGLDGVTEREFSRYADIFNAAGDSCRMFNFMQWLQFIGYRSAVMKRHHLPTSLGDCANVDSDLYLNYLRNQDIKFKGWSKHIHSEVKDFLQVLEKLLETRPVCDNVNEMIFEPSLTPYSDYAKIILMFREVPCANILTESFVNDSLEFLLRPNAYLQLAGTLSVINGGANENIVNEEFLYLYKSNVYPRLQYKKPVAVKICKNSEGDKFVDEYLDTKKIICTDINIMLSNWQQGNAKDFLLNQKMLNVASEAAKIKPTKVTTRETYKKHYNAFERYWLNIPINPSGHNFSRPDAEAILDKLPFSFATILNECARIGEQNSSELFSEFLMSEMYLVFFGEFGCKNRKDKSRGLYEIRKTLKSCKKFW